MWPVTTLLVIRAVTRAISQALLFCAHPGYEADHCHQCSQMPENNDDIFYLYNRVIVKSAGYHAGHGKTKTCFGQDQRWDALIAKVTGRCR